MIKGFNKADVWDKITWQVASLRSKEIETRPCIFLSHKREDKPACRQIAEYFKNAAIDYYLDELDDALQQASATGNAFLITESIKKGIRESTHMLVVVSEKTFKSHWVPFEVGYGHSAIVDKANDGPKQGDKIKLSILTLKDLSENTLPDFMHVGNLIRGIKSLNEYISNITGKNEKSLITKDLLFSNTTLSHPLANVLNTNL